MMQNYMYKSNKNNILLSQILKGKGIGPEGSKHLGPEQLAELKACFEDENASIITKATLLTAFWMLENTPEEKEWLENFKKSTSFPQVLTPLLTQSSSDPFWTLVLKVVDKIDLNQAESSLAADLLFDPQKPDFLKAMFLEAERLKRETLIENTEFLRGLKKNITSNAIDTPVLIDLCDPYDGQNRTPCLLPFVAPLLASLGFTTVIHGVHSMPPKNGVTAHLVLNLAQHKPLHTINEALKDLQNPNKNWTYIDQAIYNPTLWSLRNMREEMVKRPFLATFEKLLQPFVAEKNIIVTGYTHKNYRLLLGTLLSQESTVNQALVIRGVEGSSRPSLARESLTSFWDGTQVREDLVLNPDDFEMNLKTELLDKEFSAKDSLELGLQALQNQNSVIQEALVYWAATILVSSGLMEHSEAIKQLNESLISGKALAFFKAGI